MTRVLLAVLAALPPVSAAPQVKVVPAIQAVIEGRPATFRALVWDPEDPGAALPEAHDWVFTAPDGPVHSATGTFHTAGRPGFREPVQEIEVQARAAGTGILGRARLLVLRQDIFKLVGDVLGPDWYRPWSNQLPGPDPGEDAEDHGIDLVDTGFLAMRFPGMSRRRSQVVGFGLPLPVQWAVPANTLRLRLLAGAPGFPPERWDLPLPGPDWLPVPAGTTAANVGSTDFRPAWPMKRLQLHSVQPGPDDDEDLLESKAGTLYVRLRGMVPFAGSAAAPGGYEDGQGVSARFQAPAGMAKATGWRHGQRCLLVVDPVAHVVRVVDPGGDVETVGGSPGLPGHRDGPLAEARFNEPTFILTRTGRDGSEDYLVADTGNHVIRRIFATPGGMWVETLAGRPGRPGCQDHADPRQATFNRPHGIALDSLGHVCVADRGNRVIRRIHLDDHRVSTLAGVPGEAGIRDGSAREARFTDLKGLAMAPQPCAVVVVDGHSLRLVKLDGTVETWAGQVDRAGFADLESLPASAPRSACFNGPWGLSRSTRHGGAYFVADQLNHSLREVRPTPQQPRVETLVGDRRHAGIRPGLLRDGMASAVHGQFGGDPGPVPGFATLDQPGHVVPFSAVNPGDLVVATGSCLTLVALPDLDLKLAPERGAHRLNLRLTGADGPALEATAAMSELFTGDVAGQNDLPIHWTLEFLGPQGEPDTVFSGVCPRRETVVRCAPCAGPGPWRARFTYTTLAGQTLAAQARLAAPEPPAGSAPAQACAAAPEAKAPAAADGMDEAADAPAVARRKHRADWVAAPSRTAKEARTDRETKGINP
jgi:hypothetical protein